MNRALACAVGAGLVATSLTLLTVSSAPAVPGGDAGMAASARTVPVAHVRSGCTGECRLAAGGYTTYVACSYRASADPATECRLGQKKAAFFRSAKHDATYKVCVKFPGKKQRLCASAQDAPKGVTRFVSIATADTGRHTATWYVAGTKVGTWSFRVTP